MTIRDLGASAAHHEQLDTEVCIIGGGMAGLVLALSLSRRNIPVVVLESGGLATDPVIEQLNAIDNVDGRYEGAFKSRCRGLGGTSQRWGGRTMPIATAEIAPRPAIGDPGWPLDPHELTRFDHEVEALFGLDGSSYDALPASSFPTNDPDFATRWAKWPRFADCNLGATLRPALQTQANLDIWTHATTCAFAADTATGRLTSVIARHNSGRQLLVTAKQFVLAAGTIETTRLLLWLRRTSGLLQRYDGLGHNFQDHLNVQVATISRANGPASNRLFGYHFCGSNRRSLHLELSAATQREQKVRSAFAYVAMDMAGSPLEDVKSIARKLQAHKLDLPGMARLAGHSGFVARSLYWRYGQKQLFVPADVPFKLELCAEQAPHWDNQIALSDRMDRFGMPLARIHWLPRAEDERTLRTASNRLMAFWHRHGLERDHPTQWLAACSDGNAEISAHAVDYYHPSGTVPMGTDPAHSVVDGNLCCHDIPNLSVVSAAVFPTAGSANPTFTILRLALRLAAHLARTKVETTASFNRHYLSTPA